MSNLPEAIKKYDTGYWSCPHGCEAVYHEYSFTHRQFQCKDCNNAFLVPAHIKLNRDTQFVKKTKNKEPRHG